MIYITGDTHGEININKFKKIQNKYFSKKDILIILGDAAVVWSEEHLATEVELYNQLPYTVIYIDGNHENFDLLDKFPIVEKFGAKMHLITPNVFHVLRGEIMKINGLKFLCIGGAVSVDRRYRILGKSYWEQEKIIDSDIDNAIKNLEKVNYKVDYVLTHCCDTITLNEAFGFNGDACTDKLNFIDKIVKYKYWYFGHYHKDFQIDNKKRCFYYDFLEINKPYKGNSKKRYNGYFYAEEDIRNFCYVNNLPYLYSNFRYNTKITEDDLPEWYVYGRYHKRWGYISVKGIKNIKYIPNFILGTYLKYDNLKITYDNGNYILVDGYDIINVITAIEKYNDIDLNYLKLKINFKAKYYNKDSYKSCDFKKIKKPFNNINNEYQIEKIIWDLLRKYNEKEAFLASSCQKILKTDLSDKIFDKKTNYYLKSLEELYKLLLEELERGEE